MKAFMKGMKSSSVLAVFAMLAVVAVASMAQARQIYWTGTSYCGNTAWGCYARAYQNGEELARQSCMNDFGISYNTCMSAPVARTENLGYAYDADGYQFCQARVYIEVP